MNLMLKKRQVTPDTWLYVHDRNILFGRLHEPKNWSPAMVPSDEFTSLVVEYFCSFGDHIWNMSEEQLVDQTVRHLVEDLKFITPDEVIGGFTIRAPRAYPAYVIGYQSRWTASRSSSATSIICRSSVAMARSATTTLTMRSKRDSWQRRIFSGESRPRSGQRRRRVPRDQAPLRTSRCWQSISKRGRGGTSAMAESSVALPPAPPSTNLFAMALLSIPGRSQWPRATVLSSSSCFSMSSSRFSSVAAFYPFSGHDELAHFSYVRTLATEHSCRCFRTWSYGVRA